MKKSKKIQIYPGALFLAAFFVFLAFGNKTQAATLSISPSGGSFEVGSTFDVSIMLDTEGKSVNAIKASLSFPADNLQVVSPSAGISAVTLWANPPTYDNSAGNIVFEGGFTNGANLSNGLVAKITFRAKGTCHAIVKFRDDSKVLLDDGKGTNVLSQINNGIFSIVLPAPAGPEVISKTHPDQSHWYNMTSPVLEWADPDPSLVEEYSYALSDDPNEIPDDVSEGDRRSVTYSNLADGHHFFHIKALNKDKIWGGTTHYALNIDSTPPADFFVDIFPTSATSSRNPVIQFATTDSMSGIDRYELKNVYLSKPDYAYADSGDNNNEKQLFTETNSPHMARNLELGNYDVIVRAYDAAGNYRDSIKRLKVSNAIFQFVSNEGLVIGGQSVIAWPWFFLIILAIISALSYAIWRLRHLHSRYDSTGDNKKLPTEIAEKMEELRQLKEKYKGFVAVAIFIIYSFFFAGNIKAQENSSSINPPLITTISKNISNDEIFYVGGKTGSEGEKVNLYIKNIDTGETFNESISSGSRGEWFYRHDGFLLPGEYVLWAQSKSGEQLSPPSPQVGMKVNKTAIQFGSSRVSYETLLAMFIGVLFLILLTLIFYIMIFFKKIRKKSRLFKKEIREVEEAVHKGFMILHREIGKELKLMEKISAKKALTKKEDGYKEHLMNDMKKIERHIEKELTDVERLLN